MNAIVNENGRFAGTRITVYDVVPYLEDNWDHKEIADLLRLTPEQFRAGLEFIDLHKEEVMARHREIEERNARGNPPEVLAILKENQARLRAMLEERGIPLPPHLRNGTPQE